jgi:hypothetical protein
LFVRRGIGRRRRNDEGKMTKGKKCDDEGKKNKEKDWWGKKSYISHFQSPPFFFHQKNCTEKFIVQR